MGQGAIEATEPTEATEIFDVLSGNRLTVPPWILQNCPPLAAGFPI
jgi:hypothetical protein